MPIAPCMTTVTERPVVTPVPVAYVAPERTANQARFWLFLLVLAAAVTLGALAVDYRMLERALQVGIPPAVEQFEAADQRFIVLGLVSGGIGLVALGFLAAWMRQLHTNTTALELGEPRFDRSWATAGWLVPVLSWFRPKQILDDIWRAADFNGTIGVEDWRERPIPWWLNAWWASMVVGSLVAISSLFVPQENAVLWASSRGAVLVLVIGVALGGTAVVRLFTDQQAAAAWYKYRVSPRFGSDQRDVAITAGVAALAIAAAVVSYALWADPSVATDAPSAVVDGAKHYSDYGVAFDYPAELSMIETPVVGDDVSRNIGAAFGYRDDLALYAGVSWVRVPTRFGTADLRGMLDGGVYGMESSGASITLGREYSETVRGETVLIAEFTGYGQGEQIEGVIGAANCRTSDRAITVMAMSGDSLAEADLVFQQMLAGLSC